MAESKALTLSIIIPAYNEERHIRDCLESIQQQTVAPDEVILVDNNCTDRTVEIAREYDFVTVVTEPAQGLIAARNRGFAVASSSLLARIDCDARISPTWIEQAKQFLAGSQPAAITGLAWNAVIPYLPRPTTRLWSWSYFLDSEAYFGCRILWGSNMVIRRSAWQQISNQVCLDDTKVHEDQDMSILLAAAGLPVERHNDWLIYTSGEQFAYLPKVIEYARRRQSTRRYHQQLGSLPAARAFYKMSRLSRLRPLLLLPVGTLFGIGAIITTLLVWLDARRHTRP